VAIQSRTPQYGLGRHHTQTAAGHGRLTSTSKLIEKRGDYPIISIYIRK
jgi:hypothetical protein